MIKCTYFSKLLKLWLFTLLIGFFGFWVNSSVNAMQAVSYEIWHSYSSAIANSHMELWVLPKGSFISTYFWQWKSVFSPVAIKGSDSSQDSRIIYFFWNNKRPYLYVYFKISWYLFYNQGYLTSYKVCDYFTGSYPTNCSSTSLTSEWDIELLTNLLSSISLNNDYYYYYTNIDWITANQPFLRLCMSSLEYNSSICFEAWCTNYNQSACQELTGSLWLSQNLSFSDLSDSILQNPPSITWNNNWTWNYTWPTESVESTFTGAYAYYECTYNMVVDYLESNYWYSDYLCRGGLDNFNTGAIVDISTVYPWTWKWLDEIYISSNSMLSIINVWIIIKINISTYSLKSFISIFWISSIRISRNKLF